MKWTFILASVIATSIGASAHAASISQNFINGLTNGFTAITSPILSIVNGGPGGANDP